MFALLNFGGESLSATGTFFLILALGFALGFEFVNGFHDTANAVATVIYTHALRPHYAVVWSGIWNLIGVLMSSGAVAYAIVSLLPVELVINVGSSAGFAMVFSLLVSAICWNLGTWYLGLPASSSHTLIGSIMGVGIANNIISAQAAGAGVNWAKAKEVGLALLVSPIVGFCCAGLLLLLAKATIKRPSLFQAPHPGHPPPFWIRTLLIFTCTGVSWAHGSNDGQKGMGLIMLILIGIIPASYALNMSTSSAEIQYIVASAKTTAPILQANAGDAIVAKDEADAALTAASKSGAKITKETFAAMAVVNNTVQERLTPIRSLSELAPPERAALRTDIYLLDEAMGKILKSHALADKATEKDLSSYKTELDGMTKYIPDWVKYAVALALGFGTMIGWKRIVVTVGEKIGKEHLTYAQGASAELVAMGTIIAADHFGLPVSTTHVLSSGVAGTMAANGSGLQMQTLRNILLAWVLTLPVCVFLGASLFAAFLYLSLHVLGLR